MQKKSPGRNPGFSFMVSVMRLPACLPACPPSLPEGMALGVTTHPRSGLVLRVDVDLSHSWTNM